MYCTPYGQNFPATPLGGVAAHAAGACDVVETGERSSCDRQRAIKSTSTSGYFTTALAEDRGACRPRRLATSRRRWPRTVAPVDLDVWLLHDGAGRGPRRRQLAVSVDGRRSARTASQPHPLQLPHSVRLRRRRQRQSAAARLRSVTANVCLSDLYYRPVLESQNLMLVVIFGLAMVPPAR